jgi:hypothetical protein
MLACRAALTARGAADAKSSLPAEDWQGRRLLKAHGNKE